MRKELRALFVAVLLATPIVALPYSAAARPKDEKSQRGEPKNRQTLYKEVRHQLVMLPWYSVFDNLAYQVEGDKVILYGQVTRPTLKSDAEAARREGHRGSLFGREQHRGSSTLADG